MISPGQFLMAQRLGASIYAPHMNLTTPHCYTFHYHMRGAQVSDMTVGGGRCRKNNCRDLEVNGHNGEDTLGWRNLWVSPKTREVVSFDG